MRLFRSTNPMMSRMHPGAMGGTSDYPATIATFSLKLLVLTGVLVGFASFSFFNLINTGNITGGIALLIGAPIVAIISVFVAMSKPHLAMYFAFIYAMTQGIFIGAISGIYELSFGDGIVSTALLATLGVFFAMGFLYMSGLVKVTSRFRRVMFTLLLGLFFTSLVLLVLSLFGALGGLSLGFLLFISAISSVVAALYLLIDFDNVARLIESGADRQYEWVFALSMMVTLVWLYVELLRLIAILSRRRN